MELLVALLLSLGAGLLFSGSSDDDTADEPVEPTFGTDTGDTVSFGPDAVDFDGARGDDRITGGSGDDTFEGGQGLDLINGGAGDDQIFGGIGFDTLLGGSGDDTLSGGEGFDSLDGGSGDDTLFGDDGKDLLEGGTGDDDLNGGAWIDGLFGGEGNDILRGGNSTDIVSGGAGDDLVRGGDGEDFVLGDGGSDSVFGGDGDDIIVASQLFSRAISAGDFELARDGELPNDEDGDPFFTDWALSGTDADTAADMLSGGAGEDTIFIGNADIVRGGDDADDFILGDWIADGSPAEITDFDSTEDILVVALSSANSEAEVTSSLTAEGVGQIFIDGVLIAIVNGEFDANDGIDADVTTTSYDPLILQGV